MRWLRHLCQRQAGHWFDEPALQRITTAIANGEQRHAGQLVLAVEADLGWCALWRGDTPRQRAERAFARLGVWDTERNTGVLLYLLLADHAIEVVADRGLQGRITAVQWQAVCDRLRARVQGGTALADAVELAVGELSDLMARALPADIDQEADRRPGLGDRPHLL